MSLFIRYAFAAILFLSVPAAAQTWKLVSPGGSGSGGAPGVGQGVSCMPPWGGSDGFIPHGEGVLAYSTATTGSCESRSQMRWCVNGTLSGSAAHTQKHCSGACSLSGVTKAAGESHVFYSETYHANCASVAQTRTCTNGVFDGDAAFSKTTCGSGCEHGPIGTACADGAIYVGTTGSTRVYVAPSDQSGSYLWGGDHTENASGAASVADGLANTNWLAGFGSKHPAAKACKDKAGGNWYLPSQNELVMLGQNSTNPHYNGPLNLTAMGISMGSRYVTSTQYYHPTAYQYFAYSWIFSADQQTSGYASSKSGESNKVRCFRR